MNKLHLTILFFAIGVGLILFTPDGKQPDPTYYTETCTSELAEILSCVVGEEIESVTDGYKINWFYYWLPFIGCILAIVSSSFLLVKLYNTKNSS